MDSMLPIWPLPFLTMDAPLPWIVFDHLQTQKTTRSGTPLPLHAPTRELAWP